MPGPKPKTQDQLNLSGSWRANAEKDSVKPPQGKLSHPEWMNIDAKVVWDELAPNLIKMGVLTPIDVNAFARYCELYADFIMSSRLGMQGLELKVKLNIQLTRLESKFGLSASDRVGLPMQKPKDTNTSTNKWARKPLSVVPKEQSG